MEQIERDSEPSPLARFILEYCRANDLSVYELNKRAGIAKDSLGKLTRGAQRTLSPRAVYRLAAVTSMPVTTLMRLMNESKIDVASDGDLLSAVSEVLVEYDFPEEDRPTVLRVIERCWNAQGPRIG